LSVTITDERQTREVKVKENKRQGMYHGTKMFETCSKHIKSKPFGKHNKTEERV
jgi:hypothetical protein